MLKLPNHIHIYLENDIYLITEIERPFYTPAEIPLGLLDQFNKVAVGYLRWSDKNQNEGHSLEIQEKEIIARAKHEGFKVIIMFVESATSAYRKRAKNRQKMVEMREFLINNSNINAMIFYDETRVTRQIYDFVMDIVQPIREKKPNLRLYSTKTEGEWNENDIINQIRMTMGYEESKRKSERMIDYHKTVIGNSKEPKRPGSKSPFGYSVTTKRQVEEYGEYKTNEDAIIVNLIFYLYSFGHSEEKIANLLTEAQVPTSTKKSKWNKSSVQYILGNIWYKGDFVWFRRESYTNSKKKTLGQLNLFSNHHEPLIGPNMWEITQFLRDYKRKNKKKFDSPFILRDLLICRDCNEKLITVNNSPSKTKSKKKYLYYICSSCANKISANEVHQMVIDDFYKRWKSVLKAPKLIFNRVVKSWKNILNRKIADLKKEIEELKYHQRLLDENQPYFRDLTESFNNAIKEKEEKKSACTETLNKIEINLTDENLYEVIDRYKQDIFQYKNEEKKVLMLLAIKEVFIDFKDGYELNINYRQTPFIETEDFVESL